MVHNPYEAPRAAHDRGSAATTSSDATDLFLESRPTGLVNAAALTLLVAGLFQCLLAFRLMIAFGEYNADVVPAHVFGWHGGLRPVWLEAGHVAVGMLAIASFVGLRRARFGLAMLGFVACALSMVTCLFALITGSLGSLLGIGLSIAGVALLALTASRVKQMESARRALAAQLNTEGS